MEELADEGDWLELLVASERAEDLLKRIQSKSLSRSSPLEHRQNFMRKLENCGGSGETS